jgi:hypothetical protein
MHDSRSWLVVGALVGALIAGACTGEESVAPPEPMAVLVNDRGISLESVETRVAQVMARYPDRLLGGPAEVIDGIRRQILDQMIDEELLRQYAAVRKLHVEPRAVDVELAAENDAFPSEDAFHAHLAALGETVATRRAALEHRLLVERVLDAMERPTAISESEIAQLYEAEMASNGIADGADAAAVPTLEEASPSLRASLEARERMRHLQQLLAQLREKARIQLDVGASVGPDARAQPQR